MPTRPSKPPGAAAPGRARKSARRKSPSRRAADAARKKLDGAVAKELPGWEIVPDEPARKANAAEDQDMANSTEQVPSIADLKRKFLGEDAADDTDNAFETDDRKPVRIRPKKGGASKTADVGPDGKVTIVQG